MQNALYISALGMYAQKAQLDVVANNLANANTPAFKRERVDFSNLMDRTAAVANLTDEPSASGTEAASVAVTRDLSQGEFQASNSALDVAINGVGFLPVKLDNERTGYVRGGSLKINSDGYLTTSAGLLLRTDLRIPNSSTALQVDANGVVSAKLGSDTQFTQLGQLQLASFTNPDVLQYTGGGVYELPKGMDEPALGDPGRDGLGTIASKQLEMSNVKLVDEMVTLMLTQRVYELNSKVAQAADEFMSMTNNLRHG